MKRGGFQTNSKEGASAYQELGKVEEAMAKSSSSSCGCGGRWEERD